MHKKIYLNNKKRMFQPRAKDTWEEGVVQTYRVGQTVHTKYILPEGVIANDNFLKGNAFWGMLQMMVDRGYEWHGASNIISTNYMGQPTTWKNAIADYFSIFTSFGTKDSFIKRMKMVSHALDILWNYSAFNPKIPFTFYKDENGTRHISYVCIVENVAEVAEYMEKIYNSTTHYEFIYIYRNKGNISGQYKHIKLTPFSWEEIGSFPAKHRLQPKFRKYSPEEKEETLKSVRVNGVVKGKFHSLLRTDIMTRYYGWDEGDIIEVVYQNQFAAVNENTVFIKQVVTAHPL